VAALRLIGVLFVLNFAWVMVVLADEPVVTDAGGVPGDRVLRERLFRLRDAGERIDPYPALVSLCRRGSRLTGSAAGRDAGARMLARLESIGLSNVHAEAWDLPRAWDRGAAVARLVSPRSLRIPIAAYGWSGSTPPHHGAVPIVLLDADEISRQLDLLIARDGAGWSNKVLLVSAGHEDWLHLYTALLPLLRAATAAHAIAVLIHDPRPGVSGTHIEPIAVPLPAQIDSSLIPALDLPLDKEQVLEQLLRRHRSPRLRIHVENRFSPGPVAADNLVGEIPGSSDDGLVIVGAHLDSWDVGTGASDDGFGAAAVLGAARALRESGLRPRRTLRFVLFTGEEQGMLGSRAYVQQHAGELDHLVAAVVLDWGAGPVRLLPTAGHPELLPALERFNALMPELALQAPVDGWLFFTDAFAFTLAGYPGIAPLIHAPSYGEIAHSSRDVLATVNPRDLRQAAGVLALTSFFLADAAGLPATHFSVEQTATSLRAGHQEATLKAFSLFPQ